MQSELKSKADEVHELKNQLKSYQAQNHVRSHSMLLHAFPANDCMAFMAKSKKQFWFCLYTYVLYIILEIPALLDEHCFLAV